MAYPLAVTEQPLVPPASRPFGDNPSVLMKYAGAGAHGVQYGYYDPMIAPEVTSYAEQFVWTETCDNCGSLGVGRFVRIDSFSTALLQWGELADFFWLTPLGVVVSSVDAPEEYCAPDPTPLSYDGDTVWDAGATWWDSRGTVWPA